MFYLIKETLEKCKNLRPKDSKAKYVAVLSTEEWLSNSSKFDMGIDLKSAHLRYTAQRLK